MSNPLVENHTLPPFESINVEHIVPAVDELLNEAKNVVISTLENSAEGAKLVTWDNLVTPIDEIERKVSNAWSPVSHLYGVLNSQDLREQYEIAQQKLTEYYSELGQNKVLFDRYLALKESHDFPSFDQPKQQVIENAIRDFKLSGIDLEEPQASRFKTIQSRLSSLTTQFSNNVLDATQGWFKHVESNEELSGLPDFIASGAKQAAKEKGLDGYVLTLDLPVYITVQTQADNAGLRQCMYDAYVTRASDQGPNGGEWDNSPLIEEILTLRKEKAELLGFENYSELSIIPKMAESTDQVIEFLTDLAEQSKPFAQSELEELESFAKSEFGIQSLNPWDIAYYSEKLKLAKYNVSQEMLREYFPVDTVMSGLFKVAKSLFDIEIKEATSEASLCHNDARYFEIYCNNEKIAGFFLDIYARSSKRGGAWMSGLPRSMPDG